MTKLFNFKVFYCFIHSKDCLHIRAKYGSWVCVHAILWDEQKKTPEGRQNTLVPS